MCLYALLDISKTAQGELMESSSTKTVYIIGHKHPDTDSISSALAYADLKNQMGIPAVAGRLGTLNEETKFATRVFGIEAPMLMQDARSQIFDLDIDKPHTILLNASVNEAYKTIEDTQNKSLFVLDAGGRLAGICSMSNLSSIRTATRQHRQRLLSHATLKILANDLEGSIAVVQDQFKTNGHVNIITLSDGKEMQKTAAGSICILSDNTKVQMQLMKFGAACLIITLGKNISREIKECAVKTGCAIIRTRLDSMEVARLIEGCVPIRLIMTKEPVCYHEEDYVDDVASKIAQTRFRSYPVIDADGRPVGALSRYHLFRYKPKQFILVDHSSKNQSIDYIDEADICEIIDHHHIGNIETVKPIYYRNQQCGCTCTIIGQLYQENGKAPSRAIAGMMLSAIISDTLNFKSQTTTELDITMARWLARLAKVELNEYAEQLLSASVNLRTAGAHDLLIRDLKQYDFGKYHVAVGQTNYSNIEDIQVRLKEFKEVLSQEQHSGNYDLIIMMFTHVMAEGTMFLYAGPLSYVMPEIEQTKFDESSGYDHRIMSRKQQLIPVLSEMLKKL